MGSTPKTKDEYRDDERARAKARSERNHEERMKQINKNSLGCGVKILILVPTLMTGAFVTVAKIWFS